MCRRVRAADLDIDRTANVLVKEYGSEQAPLMDVKRAAILPEGANELRILRCNKPPRDARTLI
jgi:hypothetical protein